MLSERRVAPRATGRSRGPHFRPDAPAQFAAEPPSGLHLGIGRACRTLVSTPWTRTTGRNGCSNTGRAVDWSEHAASSLRTGNRLVCYVDRRALDTEPKSGRSARPRFEEALLERWRAQSHRTGSTIHDRPSTRSGSHSLKNEMSCPRSVLEPSHSLRRVKGVHPQRPNDRFFGPGKDRLIVYSHMFGSQGVNFVVLGK